MIRSFGDAETERLYRTGKSRRFPSDIVKRALMRLERLDAATVLSDLAVPPSHKLHPLGGDRAGQYAIWITPKWRLCFRFSEGDAFEVEIVDYH